LLIFLQSGVEKCWHGQGLSPQPDISSQSGAYNLLTMAETKLNCLMTEWGFFNAMRTDQECGHLLEGSKLNGLYHNLASVAEVEGNIYCFTLVRVKHLKNLLSRYALQI